MIRTNGYATPYVTDGRSPRRLVRRFLATACLIGSALAACAAENADRWAEIAPFIRPPPEYAGKLGAYVSPLKFYDGRPVSSPKEWPARRAEILKYWHEQMGPWPELLPRPKLEIDETQRRGDVTQHHVNIEVAPGVMQSG